MPRASIVINKKAQRLDHRAHGLLNENNHCTIKKLDYTVKSIALIKAKALSHESTEKSLILMKSM